jgi:hypothetical protein
MKKYLALIDCFREIGSAFGIAPHAGGPTPAHPPYPPTPFLLPFFCAPLPAFRTRLIFDCAKSIAR